MRRLRIGLAQLNFTVGDFGGNVRKMLDAVSRGRAQQVDLMTFPELAICGYPPEDLLLKPRFIEDNTKALDEVIAVSTGMTLIVGFVDARQDIYNAAAIVHNGKLVSVYHKTFLPNYGVFDEDRYFRPGRSAGVYMVGGVGIGVSICEDIWYEAGPTTSQAYSGAEIIVNISASPYYFGRRLDR